MRLTATAVSFKFFNLWVFKRNDVRMYLHSSGCARVCLCSLSLHSFFSLPLAASPARSLPPFNLFRSVHRFIFAFLFYIVSHLISYRFPCTSRCGKHVRYNFGQHATMPASHRNSCSMRNTSTKYKLNNEFYLNSFNFILIIYYSELCKFQLCVLLIDLMTNEKNFHRALPCTRRTVVTE